AIVVAVALQALNDNPKIIRSIKKSFFIRYPLIFLSPVTHATRIINNIGASSFMAHQSFLHYLRQERLQDTLQ
ncbi:MAG: hypothetical protein ABSA51_06135, partial [Anaerolineaceae bacterium]